MPVRIRFVRVKHRQHQTRHWLPETGIVRVSDCASFPSMQDSVLGSGRSRSSSRPWLSRPHEGQKPMQRVCDPTTQEMNLFTAAAFAAAIRAEIDWAHDRAVFIDCSAIASMDHSAFHALVYAHRYAIDHGHQLVIRNLQWNCVGPYGDPTATTNSGSKSDARACGPRRHSLDARRAVRRTSLRPRRLVPVEQPRSIGCEGCLPSVSRANRMLGLRDQ